MKNLITLQIALLISIGSFAQSQGINYKAVIKDGSGNVIANDPIAVQFEIREGTSTGLVVFTETHTPTTDTNGLIILTIGSVGTGFDTIDWGSDAHWLNVQVDIGGGLVDLNTTEFHAVPYALNAANVSGIEEITQGNNKGWRLKGRDPNFYGVIGSNAVDLSISDISAVNGATGNGSFAANYRTTAQGSSSSAFGWATIATGNNSLAIGQFNVADINGLFMIGNGTSDAARSNALTILINGTITAPSFDISEITDDKALITKEYLDINGSTGLEKITQGSNTGWRLVGSEPNNYGPIGSNAVDLSYSSLTSTTFGATGNYSTAMGYESRSSGNSSTAMGTNSTASGNSSIAMGLGATASNSISVAMGYGTIASGDSSTAMGQFTEASGQSSIAMGQSTIALGDYSTAMGYQTEASGELSTAMGHQAIASGSNSTALGRNTLASGLRSTTMGFETIASTAYSTALGLYNIDEPDALLMLGNGTSSLRNNALTVLNNGKTGINTSTPASLFEVAHLNSSPSNGTPQAQSFSILNKDTNNSWQFHTTDYLNLYRNGVFKGSWNATSGAYVQASDRRVKKDIISLENGTLDKVIQLNPVSYLMKDQTDSKRNLGLISQEVQEIFPSITHYVKESDLLTLSYTELIPILIKALQEQQDIIETQNSKIEAQASENTAQNQAIQAILQRMTVLEAINN